MPVRDTVTYVEAMRDSVVNVLAGVAKPLTNDEQREQAARCSCRGTDDMCPCQNAPDQQTRAQRGYDMTVNQDAHEKLALYGEACVRPYA